MIENKDMLPSLSHVDYSSTYNALGEAVGERTVFYRLGDSEVFQYANKNTMINGQRLVDIIPRMVMTDQGFIHVDYNQLDKTVQYELFEGPRYKLSCKKDLRQYIEDRSMILVYSDMSKLP